MGLIKEGEALAHFRAAGKAVIADHVTRQAGWPAQPHRAARAFVDQEVAWALKRGRPAPARLDVGAMIEAPSLVWHLDALLPMTDFVSVGTNDLMQYLFAADRGNPLVADRYDFLSPPALRALAGLQDLDSGPIIVDGQDITYERTNQRDMGMVFQAYSLFPHMNAAENIATPLRAAGAGRPSPRQPSTSSAGSSSAATVSLKASQLSSPTSTSATWSASSRVGHRITA